MGRYSNYLDCANIQSLLAHNEPYISVMLETICFVTVQKIANWFVYARNFISIICKALVDSYAL